MVLNYINKNPHWRFCTNSFKYKFRAILLLENLGRASTIV